MTYGEIRYQLSLAAPGVHLGLLDGWANDRYLAILDRIKWRRLKQQIVIQTPAVYEEGTVDVVNGSTALTGSGTTWTAAMSGRIFRVTADSPYYEFTYLTATTGTIDRAYEGATDAAAGYKIAQNVFPLPDSCRIVEGVTMLDPIRTLTKLDPDQINQASPNRGTYGDPFFYSLFMDNASDPPHEQLELYPVPELVRAVVVDFIADQDALSDTSATMLPWLRPAAIKAGVMADINRHLKDANTAMMYEQRYESAVADMVRSNSLAVGGTPMQMASRFVRHRRLRGFR